MNDHQTRTDSDELGIAVIGYGYWGPNLVRNFSEIDGANVRAVVDRDESMLERVSRRYPAVDTTREASSVMKRTDVDAVVIATPVSTHFPLAMQAIKAGKHVLVEKPMAATTEEAEAMIEAADAAGLLLMVDHSFPYTGAVRKLKELVDSGDLGQIYYYDSVRVNLGLFQHDVDVIWDLAVHDLSIIEYLFEQQPTAVSATGMGHVSGQPENIAYITLFFEDDLIAHIHVNWLSPVKLRTTLIGGSERMVLYNDLEPSEKIRVYDKGVTLETDPKSIREMRVGYRTGDMRAPRVDGTEALQRLASHFVACIEGEETPITSARSGLNVVRIMEAASESMRQRGAPIELERSDAQATNGR